MRGARRAKTSIPFFKDKNSDSLKGKNKELVELLKDITTMIKFYIFVYEIKTKLFMTNHSNTAVFRFTGLESRQFLYTLKDELERVFDKDVLTGGFMDGDLFIRVYLNSEEIDFVQ